MVRLWKRGLSFSSVTLYRRPISATLCWMLQVYSNPVGSRKSPQLSLFISQLCWHDCIQHYKDEDYGKITLSSNTHKEHKPSQIPWFANFPHTPRLQTFLRILARTHNGSSELTRRYITAGQWSQRPPACLWPGCQRDSGNLSGNKSFWGHN